MKRKPELHKVPAAEIVVVDMMPAQVFDTQRPVPAQMQAAVVTPHSSTRETEKLTSWTSSDQGARGSLGDCASDKVRAMDEDTQHQLHTSTHVRSYTQAGLHTYMCTIHRQT